MTYGGGCGVQCAGYGLGTGTLCRGVVWVRWVHWCGIKVQLKCTLGTLFRNNVFATTTGWGTVGPIHPHHKFR